MRLGVVNYLNDVKHVDATRALAKLAIFSEESEIRTAACAALKDREAKDYTAMLLAGLNYPWPAVAERSSAAIVELARKDLVPRLIDVLDRPDPRAPAPRKKGTVVRELVRVNHHHNCLLCHAPAPRGEAAKERVPPEELTADIPMPSEPLTGYARAKNSDLLVRIDVTYLRQDFSMQLPVANADPWPAEQRYDFLVRTRAVTEQEAHAIHELLRASQPEAISPYHRAALTALRALTGMDAGSTATAWRKATGY